MSLEGRVALVTGASHAKGIGRATALTLAKEGADVAVTGKSNFEGAQAVADEIKALGRKSIAVRMDVNDFADVQRAVAEVRNALGPVGILINNAAQMGQFISIAKTDMDMWHNNVYTTLFSAFHCIKACWDDMYAAKYGRIVNITSVAGMMGGVGQSAYSAAKAGVIGLAKSVALEGARYNITCNCVAVGVAKTDAPMSDDIREKLEKKLLARRLAEPQEIADAVAFSVSDKARYMTGTVVNMLGGLDLFVI
ncbi:MAG: SDR family oxidoreductase [Dehalococcoidales bacterium]|nr:SDR family oxidoreductase [Dehalococcoidales bacterium]